MTNGSVGNDYLKDIPFFNDFVPGMGVGAIEVMKRMLQGETNAKQESYEKIDRNRYNPPGVVVWSLR